MRYFLRFLLCWLILAPAFYFFGLPLLLGKLETKVKTDQYVQCQDHLKREGISEIISTEKSNKYCSCVSDAVKLDKEDILDMALRRPAKKLNAVMQPAVAACNEALQKGINAPENRPKARTVVQPDGTQVIHFD